MFSSQGNIKIIDLSVFKESDLVLGLIKRLKMEQYWMSDYELNNRKVPLIDHLTELRKRLIFCFAGLVIAFFAFYFIADNIYNFLVRPLAKVTEGQLDRRMIFTGLHEAFLTQVRVAFFSAFSVTFPVIAIQGWRFIAPGLYKKEKRFASPLFISSVTLFYAGLAFAYFVVLPLIFGFISSFAAEIIDWKPDIAEYISFVMMIILVFGAAFETPVATVLIVWTGLTTTEKLGKARPYVFLGAFVIGMLLTPPDIISQTILAIPVYILYELGIIMSKLFKPKDGR